MFYFVEFLRASRALRLAGCILVLLLIAAGIFRLSFTKGATPDAYISDLTSSRTAHITRTQLADGTTREIIDDPASNLHAVLLKKGQSFTLDITEPAQSSRGSHDVMTMGHFNVKSDTHNGIKHTRVVYRHDFTIPWAGLFVGSMLMGFIIATCLAGPLSKENDGHLELAWTKPVTRESYALAAVAVDAVTIIISQLLCIAVVILCMLMWAVPRFEMTPGDGALVGLSLVAPLAWYACLTAFSASVKRGPGLVIGMGWLGALIIPAVAGATTNSTNPVGHIVNVIFSTLCYIDPIVYLPSSHGVHLSTTGIVATIDQALLGVAILFVVYIALAVLQWRRVEA